ncbi:MAG: hypothetical protein A2521_01035 [Deltaproteobacteria bacterium RIFOXYD12_FULL_57_12]|nr:MAG: hypothetical protein A2521_01035 [Deltaproteobacteria bacterium RIFOXYD12_FULL_57_12]
MGDRLSPGSRPIVKLLRSLPALLVMGMIFFFSHLPGNSLALPAIFGFDKVLHMTAYAGLAAAVLYGLRPYRIAGWPAVILTMTICIFYGISDEYHQSFVPGRTVSAWDLAADTLGALLLVVMAWRRNWQVARWPTFS